MRMMCAYNHRYTYTGFYLSSPDSDLGAKLSGPRVLTIFYYYYYITIASEKIQNKILKHFIFALRLNGQAVNS